MDVRRMVFLTAWKINQIIGEFFVLFRDSPSYLLGLGSFHHLAAISPSKLGLQFVVKMCIGKLER
jgi:hypothetical protein